MRLLIRAYEYYSVHDTETDLLSNGDSIEKDDILTVQDDE